MTDEFANLPELDYDYNALEPHISEEQLKIHHQKHHAGYVTKSNAQLEALQKARENNEDINMKAALKNLSFNVAGNRLHSLFWKNLTPKETKPEGELLEAINKNFGSLDRFKKEFSDAANSVEGSGWAALAYCFKTKKMLLMQIEKHNQNMFPHYDLLLVLDVWEHAFYLDYKNEKAKFVESFWKIVNWDEVYRRFKR